MSSSITVIQVMVLLGMLEEVTIQVPDSHKDAKVLQ
jgi:hypothetical protein